MPLYEYVCEKDGTVIELLRSAREADQPATDPTGQGRTFIRRVSTFAAKSAGAGAGQSVPVSGGCCPCGKTHGQCGRA